MKKNLFLTGRTKCGKSSILRRELLPYLDKVGGFFIQRVFCGGKCYGFKMMEVKDEHYYNLIKHTNSIETECDLIVYLSENGRWEPCLKTFEETGVDILERAYKSNKKVILMDELGRFEQYAPRFRSLVDEILEAPVFVIGVLKKEENLFLEEIRERNNVTVVDLDVWDYEDSVRAVRSFLKEAGLF